MYCIAKKIDEIKTVMSTRLEVNVFALTEVKPKTTLVSLTDAEIHILRFAIVSNLLNPEEKGIVLYVMSPL